MRRLKELVADRALVHGKAGVGRMSWRIALYVVLGLAGFVGLRQCSRDSFEQEQASAQWQQLRRSNQVWHQRMEGLRERARHAEAQAAKAEAAARVERQRADSLAVRMAAIPLPELVPAACDPWARRLSLCEQQVAALRQAITGQDSALGKLNLVVAIERERGDSAVERVDSLMVLIPKLPKPCKVLGVKCEYVGFVLGVVAGSQLK